MEKILIIIKTFILIVGFIPSAINAILYIYPIITVIMFGIFLYCIYKKCDKSCLKYAILSILFSIASYISFISSPGTSDNFEGLNSVISSSLFASLFVILMLISLLMLIITHVNVKAKANMLLDESTDSNNDVVLSNTNIQCPYCNAWVKQNNQFCNKCGNKLH